MKTYNGNLNSKNKRYAIIVGRFNEFIGSKLLSGALDSLKRHGVKDEEVEIFWVPGAFEIPLIAKKCAKSKKFNAVICLGAVIRGATTHYEQVSNEVAKGIAQVSLETLVPVIYGVITTENIEQAIERAGTKAGNKGFDAATCAIEMANLVEELDE